MMSVFLLHAGGIGRRMTSRGAAGGGAVYFLGFLGAAIYYIQIASGFWWGVVGFLKALVWPAFLVYALLQLAHA